MTAFRLWAVVAIFFAGYAAGFPAGESAGTRATYAVVTGLQINRAAKADRESSPKPNLEAGQQAAPPGL
jgi:hypothetical protein